MGREVRIGIFTAAVVVVSIWFIISISNYQIKRRNYKVTVDFNYVGGLNKGAPVRLSGVRIGEVNKVFIADQHPRIILEIQKGIKINKKAVIYINTIGVIGENYIEITLGLPDAGFYDDKSRKIPLQGRDAVSVGDLIYNLNEFSVKLGKFEKSISLINSSLSNLNTNMDDMFAKANIIMTPLKRLSKQIEEITLTANRTLKKVDNLLNEKKYEETIKTLTLTGKKVNALLDNTIPTLMQIKEGKGTLGKLIYDENLYKKIDSLSERVEKSIKRADELEFWWNADLISNSDLSIIEGSANVQLFFGKTRSYSIGLTKAGVQVPKLNGYLNLISRKFVFSGGFMQETPYLGIGLNFTDFFTFKIDSYYWNKGFDGVNLRATLNGYFKSVGLNLTFDNIINDFGMRFGLTFKFKEDNLKYLLGIM